MMIWVLGILYGLHLVGLVYGMTYLVVRGTLRGRVFPVLLLLPKYLVYWVLISFGFKRFPTWSILGGFIGGIYLSLPILYFVNRRLLSRRKEGDE